MTKKDINKIFDWRIKKSREIANSTRADRDKHNRLANELEQVKSELLQLINKKD